MSLVSAVLPVTQNPNDGTSVQATPVCNPDGTSISGGGGGGGAVTIADGSDVAEGAKADSAATSATGSWSIISLLKGIYNLLARTGNATAGTNLSGTVTTTSGGFNLAASATRKPGDVQGQNIGANNIGFNEFGGTAAIGTAGTYTVVPGATFSITTNQLVNFIAATGNTAVTITGV
jgi:hypothetical protein